MTFWGFRKEIPFFFQKVLDIIKILVYTVGVKGMKDYKNMKVEVICDGRKGSVKNPAAMSLILYIPFNGNNPKYSRFYMDFLYSNELREWYPSRMNHAIDEQVVMKNLFDDELVFSRKVCNRLNKVWKNKNW